jgi:DNA helicase-2/ATP-dependent DNA helicase PcrA
VKHLEGLNEAQKQAVMHSDGPILIVAGAGAGKTKTITHRIVQLISTGTAPQAILAVTFTNKAAGEMRERVGNLLGMGELSAYSTRGPLITTFHSLGARLLREFAEEAGIPPAFAVWDRDDSSRALKKILKDIGYEDRFPPRQILSAISRAKGDGETWEDHLRDHSAYKQAVGEAWRAYDAMREKEGALDFSDLLAKTVGLLAKQPQVLAKLQDRWHYLTIDEYQDTNRSQFEIARLLAGEKKNICAVGDMDQCIYSWNGADIGNLMSFERQFPGTRIVLLEENYRSTQTIITAANGVISKNKNRYDKRLNTNNPTGAAISLFAGETERDEAFYIAREARSLLGSGVKPSEIAVLFRQNFQSRSLEEAFITTGIPYRVLGVRFFDRAEVKDVLSYIRAARNPASSVDFARAAGSPSRGIGATTLEKYFAGAPLAAAAQKKLDAFRTLLRRIREASEALPASQAVHFALRESGLETLLNADDEGKERLGNVFELVAHATRFDALPAPEGIALLLEDAALMGEQDALQKREEAVSLMTVHASKGLEFDAVFVTGLEHGLFPQEREGDDRDTEEERRLFYVALTRARNYLYLTLAGSRLKYGTRERTVPSGFLDDIDQRLISFAEPQERLPTIQLL